IPTTNMNPGAIRLVADVHIQAISTLATRVVTLAFMSTGSVIGLNLADRFADELVANPDLLVATNHATGAALTITSAAKALINGQHGITYTFDATGFPVASGSIDLRLDEVSVLAADGLQYYETPLSLNIPV